MADPQDRPDSTPPAEPTPPAKKQPAKKAAKAPAKKAPAKKAPAKKAPAKIAPVKKAPAAKAPPEPPKNPAPPASPQPAPPSPESAPPKLADEVFGVQHRAESNGELAAAAKDAAALAKSTVDRANNPLPRDESELTAGHSPVPLIVAITLSLLALLLVRQLRRR